MIQPKKLIQIHFLMAFSIHEVAPFCLFCHILLFLCSDIIQIYNCIMIGGNLWIKFHFFQMKISNFFKTPFFRITHTYIDDYTLNIDDIKEF
jgi:hypothetical protein